MTFFVAASDSSAADRASADLVCNGSNDRTVVQQAWGRPGERVQMLDGHYDVDRGSNGVDGNPYLYPGAGTVITGGPGVVLQATNGICRITVQHENVKISGLTCRGYVAIQWYCTANHLTIEDTSITHSLDGKTYLPFGKKGGATAAFMGWGSVGQTMQDITIRNCTASMTYHHGFSLNLGNGSQGGGFMDILFDGCKALSCGSGQEGDGLNDWSCGFDIPDAGNINGLTVQRCLAKDSWQDGFHLDGSWDGHEQIATNVLFEDCEATDSGQRSGTLPTELYQSGFYVQDATLRRCTSRNSRKAGYLIKNEEFGGLKMESCLSIDDGYGLVIEFGGGGAEVSGFVASGSRRRALQLTAADAGISASVVDFRGTEKPVLLGITERLEFVDAPGHAADLARYRGISRPFSGSLALTTDRQGSVADLVEVNPASTGAVDLSGVTIKIQPPGQASSSPRTDPLPIVPLTDDKPITPVTPPTTGASFTITPASAHVGDQVRFTVMPADGKMISSTWWTFDADRHKETWNGRDRSPSFFYPAAGTFSPLVEITYTDGSIETVKQAGGVVIL